MFFLVFHYVSLQYINTKSNCDIDFYKIDSQKYHINNLILDFIYNEIERLFDI